MMTSYYKLYTAKAPVNIAVIKYWGKKDEKFKIPINDSLSGTLSIDEMCATTSLAISDTFRTDELWLNGQKQELSDESNAGILLQEIKKLSKLETEILNLKVHIVSYNNFPTAAGLASSAAGYACLAYVLGQAFGVEDLTLLSKLARRGSGSACRSLFGGFVEWHRGYDHDTSKAQQIVDHSYWPEMRVIICVISDNYKDVSSSEGMIQSVKTSKLIEYRSHNIVPQRMASMKEAILNKDFESFANVTMQDSNQFHAICLDTFPPIFYLNDASRQVIKLCSIINAHYGHNKLAYTFDAGPNACIYLLEDFVDIFLAISKQFFPLTASAEGIPIKGKAYKPCDQGELKSISQVLKSKDFRPKPDSISYIINTSIGHGPILIQEHIQDDVLAP